MPKETATQTLQKGFRLQSKERDYEIVSILGAGSFGITYLATSEVPIGNITTTIRFAIKEHFMSASCYRGDDGATVHTVPSAKSDVVDSRADFITEANRLKKLCLKSRNIVSVNETFEANGTAYYVMEFLDGGNPSKCSEAEALSIVIQIADALARIHNEHVLHLDLKPDNIVFKTNDKNETYPVLIDFGISKHFDSKGRPTSSLSAKGASPGYAPQEQYAGVNEFSPKYDIYALGAVLFYLCTGKNPPDAFKISPNQQELKKELAGKVSPNIEKTILNAMKPSAIERTPTVNQFCDDLMGIDFIPMLDASSSMLEFGKKKAVSTVAVDSNIGWTAYADKDWCKVTKSTNSIVISVSQNKETGSRTCDVVINGTPYQISQVINITQAGGGTVVFPTEQSWWKRNCHRIYAASGIFLGGVLIAGLSTFFKPNHEKESRSLTQAIDQKDGQLLAKYANLDSIRAYLPYAQFLYEQGDIEASIQYATKAKAVGGDISGQGEELLAVLNAKIEHARQDTTVNQGNTPEKPMVSEHENEPEIIVESNDEKFARASNDFNLMLALAKENYTKAYYPLAEMYFARNDKENTRLWAQKSVDAKVNQSKARALLKKAAGTSTQATQNQVASNPSQTMSEPTKDKEKRLQEALKDPKKGFINITMLAEIEHYAPAYYHYARELLQQGETTQAKKYLQMSIEKGINVSLSQQLLEILDE